MAEPNESHWTSAVNAGISVVSGVLALATFANQTVPGPLASAAVLAACAVAGGSLLMAVRRGHLFKRDLSPQLKSIVWAVVGVLVAVAVGLGWTIFAAAGSKPAFAAAASAAERDKPYPATKVESASPYGYEAHTTKAETSGSLKVRYYLVSDREFWETLFDRRSFVTEEDPSDGLTGDASEKRLITQLLDPESSLVVKTEPLQFAGFLWREYLRDRRPVGRLTKDFKSVKDKVVVDARFKRDRVSEYEDVVWFNGSNADLLNNGWLELDPLSKQIVQANPELKTPIAKAGAIKWSAGAGCGEEDEQVFEYSFLIPRAVQLVFADVYNTSDVPVETVTLDARTSNPAKADMFRLHAGPGDLKSAIATEAVTYEIPGGLAPGDHALIPIGVRLSDYTDAPDYDPASVRSVGFFGPAVTIDSITQSGAAAKPVRALKEKNLAFVTVGYETGSCPSLMTWSNSEARWIKDRNILIGAHGIERKRTERHLLRRFDGEVQIREMDHEVSFIDSVHLEALDRYGRTVSMQPSEGNLLRSDGVYLRLPQGDSITLRFDGWDPSMREPALVVDGYYEPYAGARVVPAWRKTVPSPK